VLITNITDVKTTTVTNGDVALNMTFEINNPNRFKIVLKQYDIIVSLNDKALGHAGSTEKIKIKPRSADGHPFLLTATYNDFIAASFTGLGSLLKSEPITLNVKGTIKGRVGWLRKTIPINSTQKIKL
jgi:LEA14-like dessication related protein